MASKDFSILDMQNDDEEINLEFQDFQNDPGGALDSNTKEQTVYFSDFPDSAQDQEQQLIDDDPSQPKTTHSFWTFEYYQQYFDVETKHVTDRILWSMIPKPGIDYLRSYIRPNPDLYGPFWICTTLVMTTAIMGNIANYLQNEDSSHWKYDFHKVSLAASSVFTYAWLVPIIIWAIILWRGSQENIKLLELICIYGYSLSVYIPVSIVWTVPVPWLQWCLGIVATVLSGSVLVRAILPALSHESKKIGFVVSVVILVLHGALAISFMMYFFHIPASNQHQASTLSPPGLLANQPQIAQNLSDSKIVAPTITKRSDISDAIVPKNSIDFGIAAEQSVMSATKSEKLQQKPVIGGKEYVKPKSTPHAPPVSKVPVNGIGPSKGEIKNR